MLTMQHPESVLSVTRSVVDTRVRERSPQCASQSRNHNGKRRASRTHREDYGITHVHCESSRCNSKMHEAHSVHTEHEKYCEGSKNIYIDGEPGEHRDSYTQHLHTVSFM